MFAVKSIISFDRLFLIDIRYEQIVHTLLLIYCGFYQSDAEFQNLTVQMALIIFCNITVLTALQALI